MPAMRSGKGRDSGCEPELLRGQASIRPSAVITAALTALAVSVLISVAGLSHVHKLASVLSARPHVLGPPPARGGLQHAASSSPRKAPPPAEKAQRAAAPLEAVRQAAPNRSSHPGGTVSEKTPPVVVGHCRGNNFCSLVNPRKFVVDFVRAAFPERAVVVNELGRTCMPTQDTEHGHTDIVAICWNQHDASLKDPIASPRDGTLLPYPPDTGEDDYEGMLVYRKTRIVKHHRGRTFVIGMHGEAYGGKTDAHDLMIEAKRQPAHVHSTATSLWWPQLSRNLMQDAYPHVNASYLTRHPDRREAQALLASKPNFCAFRHSVCDDDWHARSLATPSRVALFDAIGEHYKPCSGVGACRGGGHGGGGGRKGKYQRWTNNKGLQPYKFVFAAENSHVAGFWNEKMFNAVQAQSVPIVLGTATGKKLLSRFVNMDRIIFCAVPEVPSSSAPKWSRVEPEVRIRYVAEKFREQFKDCVDEIRRVDKDDELWIKKVSTPFIKGNTVAGNESLFSWETYGQALRRSLQEHQSYLIADSELARGFAGTSL